MQDISKQMAERLTGQTLPVLVEEINSQDASLVTGRLSNNLLVHFPGGADLIGQIVDVRLLECKGFLLYRREVLTWNKVTPMMQQYLETKKNYPDCILFYRLGDFYEMFFDDALVASKELEITLTGKNCGMEERAPMCGIPYHAVDNYLNKLVSKGYKVAICEQMEDPKQAKGIVKRDVIRIVTPGTNLDNLALDETRNNYLMCIVCMADKFGVSIADISTGAYLVTELDSSRKLTDEIFKFSPKEIICTQALLMSGVDVEDLKERLGIAVYAGGLVF